MLMSTSAETKAAHNSIVRTVPLPTVVRAVLSSCRGRMARAVPPTTTVSVTANCSREGASAGRAYCEVAMARPGPRPLRQHGTRMRAPPRRDLTLGRAPTTPA
jgi:hypothetical protein